MKHFVCLLVMLFPSSPLLVAVAQEQAADAGKLVLKVSAPEGVQAGNLARLTSEGSNADRTTWLVFPPTENFIVDSGGKTAWIVSPVAATYTVILVGADADELSATTANVTFSGGVVVPPGPNPPTPVPPAPPVPSGKRALLLIHETGDTNPAHAILVNQLRTGPAAAALKTAGHSLFILDDDATDPDGNPSKVVADWLAHGAGMKLPVLFVYDKERKTILEKIEVTPAMTADDFVKAANK